MKKLHFINFTIINKSLVRCTSIIWLILLDPSHDATTNRRIGGHNKEFDDHDNYVYVDQNPNIRHDSNLRSCSIQSNREQRVNNNH